MQIVVERLAGAIEHPHAIAGLEAAVDVRHDLAHWLLVCWQWTLGQCVHGDWYKHEGCHLAAPFHEELPDRFGAANGEDEHRRQEKQDDAAAEGILAKCGGEDDQPDWSEQQRRLPDRCARQ